MKAIVVVFVLLIFQFGILNSQVKKSQFIDVPKDTSVSKKGSAKKPGVPLSTGAGFLISDDPSATPDPSAILDVKVTGTTKKGVLIPRMTSSERLSISSPAVGLLVYQTDGTPGFYYWDGSVWQRLSLTGEGGLPSGSAGQTLRHDGTNWVASSLIYNDGSSVGIGTTNPLSKLHVAGDGSVDLILQSAGISRPGISGYHSRGTLASPSATQADDILLFFGGRGYDGTSYGTISNGAILIKAAENFTVGSRGTYIAFETTPLGSTTRQERVRITADGRVGIGTSTPSKELDVVGNIKASGLATGGLPRVVLSDNVGNLSISGAGTDGQVLTWTASGPAWAIPEMDVASTVWGPTAATAPKSARAILISPIYIPGRITVNQIRLRVTTALGDVGDVGIYDSNGNLVLNGGDGSLTTAVGVKTIVPQQANRTLNPGQYYVAVTWNSSTGVIAGASLGTAGSMNRTGYISTGGGTVLPTTINLNAIIPTPFIYYFSLNK